MALPYTSGNWTLSSLHVDSVSTAKSVSVTDVDMDAEFTASLTPVNASQNVDLDQAMFYADQTGDGLQPVGNITLGRKAVRNVYTSSSIAASEQLPQKGGHRVYLNVAMHYKAANSVSGTEYVFPVTGSIAVTVPDWSAVPVDVLEHFLAHLDGVMRNGSSSSAGAFPSLVAALRGDLDMTR